MTTDNVSPIHLDHTALLVMDYQNGILGLVENADELLAITGNLIRMFRDHGGTVGYVRVAFADGELDDARPTSGMLAGLTPERAAMFHADAPTTQIHESIAPQVGDIVVRKQRVSAFSTTDLEEQLEARGIDTLVLAGISTSGVVLSTLVEAFDFDYRVIVLSDACADPDPEAHRFLTESYFPKRANVIEVRQLHDLMH